MGASTSITVSGSDTVGPQIHRSQLSITTIDLSNGAYTSIIPSARPTTAASSYAMLRFDGALGSTIFSTAPPIPGRTAPARRAPASLFPCRRDLPSYRSRHIRHRHTFLYTTAQLRASSANDADGDGLRHGRADADGAQFRFRDRSFGGRCDFPLCGRRADRSGVSYAILRFDGALGSYYIFGSNGFLGGRSSASTASVPVSTAPGTYHLTEVDLYDAAETNRSTPPRNCRRRLCDDPHRQRFRRHRPDADGLYASNRCQPDVRPGHVTFGVSATTAAASPRRSCISTKPVCGRFQRLYLWLDGRSLDRRRQHRRRDHFDLDACGRLYSDVAGCERRRRQHLDLYDRATCGARLCHDHHRRRRRRRRRRNLTS